MRVAITSGIRDGEWPHLESLGFNCPDVDCLKEMGTVILSSALEGGDSRGSSGGHNAARWLADLSSDSTDLKCRSTQQDCH